MAVEQVGGQRCDSSPHALTAYHIFSCALSNINRVKHKLDEEIKLMDVWQETTGTHC